ncbi:MAG: cytochrome c, partial [Bradyrhizobium sp.]
MKRSTLILLSGVVATVVGGYWIVAAGAKPVAYKLPDETAAFKPGPNLEVVQNNCTACHSADYVAIQPRGPK